jgi:hypothetical protein
VVGSTRGKWRMQDGKVGEWFVFMFEAPKVLAPAYGNEGPHRLVPEK